MSVSYNFHEDIAEIIFSGQFSDDEVLQQFEAMTGDPDLSPTSHMLLNVTASGEMKSQDALRPFAAVIASVCETLSGRVAFLVAQTVHYGMARQFGVLLEGYGLECNVFYDRDEAVRWLTR